MVPKTFMSLERVITAPSVDFWVGRGFGDLSNRSVVMSLPMEDILWFRNVILQVHLVRKPSGA